MTRLSIHKSDPGYSPQAFTASVFLDGELLRYCFTADEELREAYCYDVDENSDMYLDDTGEAVQEITFKGDVVIAI